MPRLENEINKERFRVIIKLARKAIDDLEVEIDESDFKVMMSFKEVIEVVRGTINKEIDGSINKYKLAKGKKI